MKCNDCKFWISFKGSKESGQCRINPPVMHVTGGGAFGCFAMDVKEDRDDWCGKHEFVSAPKREGGAP